MKKIVILVLLMSACFGNIIYAQEPANFISCKVDGKDWKAEARRIKIPVSGFEYLAMAAFKVSPDVQVWIRMYYFTDSLKAGTYPIISENDMESDAKIKANHDLVWVLVDYTEETKGLGHAYHDGESLSGTLTIDKVTKTSIDGSFDATLKGVFYTKRTMATMSGAGIMSNIEKKAVTGAGGGMLANDDPHDHENTKKSKDTDTIVLSGGSFHLDWSTAEKTGK
jgi:hypothetical protein